MHEIELSRKRMARYRILKILDASDPTPCGEGLIRMTLPDCDLPLSPNEIRKEIQYLGDKGYVKIEKPEGERHHWLVRILPKGTDYLEDQKISDPGIARPEW